MEPKPLIYQFDDVRVEVGDLKLCKAGRAVHLEPKAFAALVYFIENRGRLIEKQELLDAVWKEAFVTENAMTRIIAQLRRALGDDSKQARFIETVPTRGYRFIAEVKKGDEAGQAEIVAPMAYESEKLPDAQLGGEPARKISRIEHLMIGVRRHKLAFGSLALALLSLIGGGYFLFAGRPEEKPIDSIAVLPFVNTGTDPNMEYLSEGISDSIVNSLSQLPKLRVLPWSRVSRYRGREVDPMEAGRELGVRAVMVGKVRQRGDGLAISAELVDVSDNRRIWGDQYNHKLSDILVIQDEIARQISAGLRLRLTGEEKKQLTKRYTEDKEAYHLYLKGHYYLRKGGQENIKKAIEHFEQAIAKDPGYSLAYAELATCYGSSGIPTREAEPKVKGLVQKALELDDTVAEAHIILGWMKLSYEWDWAGAERAFARAVELNTNLIEAHLSYSQYLLAVGRFEEAIGQVEQALEIDPVDLGANFSLAERYYYARRYDDAIEQARKTLDLDPNRRTHGLIGRAYEEKGMYKEAIEEYLKVRSQAGDGPNGLSDLGCAYAAIGKRDEAQKIIAEMKEQSKRRYISPVLIAAIYSKLGDKEQTFAYLEKAYEDRDVLLTWLKAFPRADSLRSDPRFEDLLRRIGLSP